MPCTTLLVGKEASYDGSNMIARNDDSGAGSYTVKKFTVILPDEQPSVYQSRISHLTINLPDHPLRYTAVPNVDLVKGLWDECGVNECGVGMSATETITSNPRVLGADPLVVYDSETGRPGGLGEEDFITVVLPYVKTAREGVKRLGELLEQYGTYEMNGIGFSDDNEIWWLETVGGHHWIARRVPDDSYVVVANQFSIDSLDFEDAFGNQSEYMCSKDLEEFIKENNLDLTMDGKFNPREAFGSHDDSDHVYNTPRVWYVERYFNSNTVKWDGSKADFTPQSDDLPWAMIPEHKITPEDVKYALSTHYQGTPFDPYLRHGDRSMMGAYRPVGINRTSFLGLVQNRPGKETLEWLAFAANPFNVMTPYYSNVTQTPTYLNNTTLEVDTDNAYWTARLIAAMADASYQASLIVIERYQKSVSEQSVRLIRKYDDLLNKEKNEEKKMALRIEANIALAEMTKKASQEALNQILYNLSNQMKDSFARSDA